MTGDINQPVQGKHKRSNQGGEAETLVGADLQRSDATDQQYRAQDDERQGYPSELGPNPKPIAFGMKRSGIAVRSVAKDGKNRFEITKAKPDPGRRADQLPGILENKPAKIRREIGTGEFWR